MVKSGGDVIVNTTKQEAANFPPLVSTYNEKIRPILDAVDKLRRLNVTQEGIPLPTIVVVGDQSSGKSSVLESLAGITLPRGQGICTRVPLIMRLQHNLNPDPEFVLEYQNKSVNIMEEGKIAEAIDKATVEIAGASKGISNVPLTLVVKKRGVPDLTMVDLPGITRAAVDGQPENIADQISEIIMEHIKPEESIILMVLNATQDFSTCESICMSRRVDSSGQRTLAVVTKCDQNPDGLHEKVTKNDVNIRLGYICVRNRINNETYDEARMQENKLFETHTKLCKIEKSMVGIPALAQRLVEIQSVIISRCLPDIVKKISEKLNASVLELNKFPRNLTTIPEAMAAFMQMVGSFKETLQKILIRGEFDAYVDEKEMHCDARLIEMLDNLSKELHKSVKFSDNFLVEEMLILQEANGIRLPNFVPHSMFLLLLQRKVNGIADLPVAFADEVWDYIETVCINVLVAHAGNYPQLLSSVKKATSNVMATTKAKFMDRVVELIEMEKITDYTCDPDFISSYDKLMCNRDAFLKSMINYSATTNVEGYGTINVKHLHSVSANTRDQAFEMKMKMTAYWKIVLKRIVDCLALHLRFLMQDVVNKGLETEVVNEIMVRGGGIEKLLDEPSSLAKKRESLQKSIGLLKESKEIIEQVMDNIVAG
uniref:dynamin-related protein 4C-like n=1 Tax=Erigeron canadensis TaxID=72917 RepID=UPI001CB8912E|nr:dynamin-related protein 4C-like [Erigeron canadensis]